MKKAGKFESAIDDISFGASADKKNPGYPPKPKKGSDDVISVPVKKDTKNEFR